jgi:RNA polymerase sigma-70 factor (ECF subfamily)
MANIDESRAAEFAALVTRHQGQLYGYVYALVQNSADADDLVQRTVLTLWRRFDQFEPDTDFAAWAWKTARYEVFNFLKTKNRSPLRFSDALVSQLANRAGSTDPDRGQADRAAALASCVEALPPTDRQLVLDRYQGDQQVQGLAAQLGRSTQSVSNSLARIRRALFQCIQRRLAQESNP